MVRGHVYALIQSCDCERLRPDEFVAQLALANIHLALLEDEHDAGCSEDTEVFDAR
jgi:hypothetical protein